MAQPKKPTARQKVRQAFSRPASPPDDLPPHPTRPPELRPAEKVALWVRTLADLGYFAYALKNPLQMQVWGYGPDGKKVTFDGYPTKDSYRQTGGTSEETANGSLYLSGLPGLIRRLEFLGVKPPKPPVAAGR